MKQGIKSPAELLTPGRALTLANVAEGAEGLVISDLARAIAARPKKPAVSLAVVCRDGGRMQQLERALQFFAPDLPVLTFPAWDCQPYDRVSPHGGILAQRLTTLARLAPLTGSDKPLIVLTTVNAILQRVPARELVAAQALSVAPGNVVPMDTIVAWLEHNGYNRSSTVREPGEYAVRGGILDLFPAGLDQPVRFDFFGDSLESIRSFDAETQRTMLDMRSLDLVPISEFQLVTDTIRRFRMGYVAEFGAPERDDALYEAVSEGRRHPGMEHWLPLFQDRMDTLFDYLQGAAIAIEPQAEDAVRERFKQIQDYYEARRDAMEHPGGGAIYKPLPPDRLYLTDEEWTRRESEISLVRLTQFSVPADGATIVDAGARKGRDFAPERNDATVNVFESVVSHVMALHAQRKKVVIALWSEGSRDRMTSMLRDHKLTHTTSVNAWRTVQATPRNETMLAVLGLEAGFETDEIALISEQDILGDRLVRPRKASRKLDNFISEVTSLTAGDIVVHADHGIGRFIGLQTLDVAGAPHDCLELHYAADAKLFLPVENIELLSRYGSDQTTVELDRLGGSGWQTRKAKLKNRIREIAGELIKIAAARHLHEAPKLPVQPGLYDEFCARFPYDETEDQLGAIESTLKDLELGRPMDRLICGDVGFGKTEVALRAAFAVALEGKQVAVVVPTTLLARQHHKTFTDRFKGFPVNVAQASRLVPTKALNLVKKGIADGSVDIVVGTHALLGKAIKFRDLGLVIVDEEQHFGVTHKERLKALRSEVHVLTLSATPIPRTLQLALTGVRELSIIASPPVDRLAVRTFVAPHDPLMIREGAAARALSRRPGVLRGAAHRRPRRGQGLPRQERAGDEGRGRARPDAARGDRGHHDRLLRRQVRHPAVDHHRGVRPRHSQRQHADRAPCRHVRPGAAVSAPRPRRPLQAASLCAVHAAGAAEDHRAGRAPAHRVAIAGDAGRGLPARLARPRHPRRRQPARRGAVRPHQGSRLRALPVDAGGGDRQPQGRRVRARRRPLVALDHHRHARAHSGRLCRRPLGAAVAVPAARRSRHRGGDREFWCGDARPFWRVAGRGALSVQGRRDQGVLPHGQCREDRRRPEGRGHRLPR
ncbi:transcription-repair coupling factor (superfamily II helicase) [Bradyrhizobium sp. i1.7.7]